MKGEGFITDGGGAWFDITALYDTATYTDSYQQFTLHNISSIKFLNKIPDEATIIIAFEKFIATLREY